MILVRIDFFIPLGLDVVRLLEKRQMDVCTSLLKDKLHYLIDRLYLSVVVMKHEWTDFIPIHSQVLADVLGTRDAPRVKKILLQLGIIEVQKNGGAETYKADGSSKRYRLSKKYRGREFHSVPIQNRRFV